MPYFPMYVNIENKSCLVIGGGKVACRKAAVLLDFGASVSIASKSFCDEIKMLNADFILGEIDFSLCDDKELVVCATDDRELNQSIFEYCNKRRIPVNVVDDAKNSTFIFSSYIKQKNLVASFSSSGNSPMLTQILKQSCELTPFLGELNELLGKCRGELNKDTSSEIDRKTVYKAVYDLAVKENEIPTIEKVEEIINELQGGNKRL